MCLFQNTHRPLQIPDTHCKVTDKKRSVLKVSSPLPWAPDGEDGSVTCLFAFCRGDLPFANMPPSPTNTLTLPCLFPPLPPPVQALLQTNLYENPVVFEGGVPGPPGGCGEGDSCCNHSLYTPPHPDPDTNSTPGYSQPHNNNTCQQMWATRTGIYHINMRYTVRTSIDLDDSHWITAQNHIIMTLPVKILFSHIRLVLS